MLYLNGRIIAKTYNKTKRNLKKDAEVVHGYYSKQLPSVDFDVLVAAFLSVMVFTLATFITMPTLP